MVSSFDNLSGIHLLDATPGPSVPPSPNTAGFNERVALFLDKNTRDQVLNDVVPTKTTVTTITSSTSDAEVFG